MHINDSTQPAERISLADLWDDAYIDERDEWLHHKREDAAIELNSLLLQAGISRADLARRLDWKPSRVTRALSGNENLTINTIAAVIDAAGMDFDIVFRKKGSCRTFQPWEAEAIDIDVMQLRDQLNIALGEVSQLHRHATANLETALQINRAMFRRATEMKHAAISKNAPAIICEKMTYEENDETIASAA